MPPPPPVSPRVVVVKEEGSGFKGKSKAAAFSSLSINHRSLLIKALSPRSGSFSPLASYIAKKTNLPPLAKRSKDVLSSSNFKKYSKLISVFKASLLGENTSQVAPSSLSKAVECCCSIAYLVSLCFLFIFGSDASISLLLDTLSLVITICFLGS